MALDYDHIKPELISHFLFIKIQAVYDVLKTAERKAANFILQHPEDFLRCTISECAKASGSSEATFVRLSKRLGYAGFPELKIAAENLGADEPSGVIGVSVDEEQNPVDIMHKIFDSSIQSLKDTLSIIDTDAYTKAVDAICNAKRIAFAGTGDAYSVAYAGYLRFFRAGVSASCHMDFDLQVVSASQLGRDGVLVVVSYSGKTKTMLELILAAKASSATVILISNFPKSPLAKHADIVLCTATFAPLSSGEVMSKRIPELCIMESLYTNALVRNYPTYSHNIEVSDCTLRVNKTGEK